MSDRECDGQVPSAESVTRVLIFVATMASGSGLTAQANEQTSSKGKRGSLPNSAVSSAYPILQRKFASAGSYPRRIRRRRPRWRNRTSRRRLARAHARQSSGTRPAAWRSGRRSLRRSQACRGRNRDDPRAETGRADAPGSRDRGRLWRRPARPISSRCSSPREIWPAAPCRCRR